MQKIKKANPQNADVLASTLKKIIQDIAGSSTEKIVELLYKKQHVNEFIIAKNLGTTINQTRNILYKLADEGLISFVRKKDKKKGGWYIYFWTLKVKKSLEKLKEKLEKQKETLLNQLNILSQGRHFYCKNCHIEYNEENAMTHDFICPECGEVLELRDISPEQEKIKKEIARAENEILIVSKEIDEIEGKELKTREKTIKKEEELKKAEKEKKLKERRKLLKKTQKKKPDKKHSKKKKRK